MDFIVAFRRFKIMKNPLNNTNFIKSAIGAQDFVTDSGMEIAVIGRSNAGKSSAINKICNNKKLAKTSKKPGRTQAINFFEICPNKRLVDLPGYGYANISMQTRKQWNELLNAYFATRKSLCCIFLTVDIRRSVGTMDVEVMDWIMNLRPELSIHILLTKSDALSRSNVAQTLNDTLYSVEKNDHISVQIFSSHDSTGVNDARREIIQRLSL